MSHEKIKRMAESVGLAGLRPDELERLSRLTVEAEANVRRLPKLRKEDEPAHVFFVPQRTS
jgi:hypothetical protein